jgi:hypothetical protein
MPMKPRRGSVNPRQSRCRAFAGGADRLRRCSRSKGTKTGSVHLPDLGEGIDQPRSEAAKKPLKGQLLVVSGMLTFSEKMTM